MVGRKIVVRTLDAGADKPLPFLNQVHEENPALGVRGLRTARRSPEVLRTTSSRLWHFAQQATGAVVWVMAPDGGHSRRGEMVHGPARHENGLPIAG